MVHKGLVDVKMWTRMPDQLWIREKYWYLITDFVYLGGTAICFFAISFVGYYADMPFIDFVRWLLIGGLIGDEVWDLSFGYVVDQDCFYPFPNWYGGWGFKSKTERILFDSCRIALAVLIYITTLIK